MLNPTEKTLQKIEQELGEYGAGDSEESFQQTEENGLFDSYESSM